MKAFTWILLLAAATVSGVAHAASDVTPDRDPAWARAHLKPPMTVEETRAFMKRRSAG
jgi:hypothetical protein